ncbi:MAG: glycosyltransferase family 4 protein [candidate division KSB1 bacterium]|nr:glycosyltransferase family 4 protein [candidate division KSB1 bacterium]
MSQLFHILQIGPLPPPAGGMETFMKQLLNSSLRNDYRLSVLNMSKPGIPDSVTAGTSSGYREAFMRPVFYTLLSYFWSVLYFIRFMLFLGMHQIHIVHIHSASYTSFWEKCLYIAYARVLKKRIVLHIHGSCFQAFYMEHHRAFQRWIHFLLGLCDRVVVLSPVWKRFFQREMPRVRTRVIENGIRAAGFHRKHG